MKRNRTPGLPIPAGLWIIAALLAAVLALPAAAQNHGSVTVRGNHSHSAVIQQPQTQRVGPPLPPIVVGDGVIFVPGFGYGHGHHHVHTYHCHYTPGHYENRVTQVWVPAHWEQQYFPPRYELRVVNGREMRTLVEKGGYKPVWVEGQYVTQTTQVWVPARWSCGY